MPAQRGEPAGTLYVELTESPTYPEGFVVRTRGQVPENRNPTTTEILPQNNVVFEAIGGDGETGRRGCDGQSGMNGTPGGDATRVQDATVSSGLSFIFFGKLIYFRLGQLVEMVGS